MDKVKTIPKPKPPKPFVTDDVRYVKRVYREYGVLGKSRKNGTHWEYVYDKEYK